MEPKARRTANEKTRDPRSVKKFLEELSWVLSSYPNLDFRAIRDVLEKDVTHRASTKLESYASRNPNIHFLIGALPVIFSNEDLFPSNEDIVEFAEGALRLPIPRWGKRSRYELIGLIVCETAQLNDDRLERLVRALSKVIDDPRARAIFRDRKAQKLNWNEVIQRLTGD
jgi:hypothetical protein